MKLRGLRLAALSLFACAAVCAQVVRAHEFKLDAVINAFVKIERAKRNSSSARRCIFSSRPSFQLPAPKSTLESLRPRSSGRWPRSNRTSRYSKTTGPWSHRTRGAIVAAIRSLVREL